MQQFISISRELRLAFVEQGPASGLPIIFLHGVTDSWRSFEPVLRRLPTDVRAIAMSLPRTSEHLIRGHVKFRVGRIVYASVSPDEERLGFGFPREERAALVASRPETFMMPLPSDERYQWVRARLAALDVDELRELLTDAWCMCVPKKVRAAYLEGQGL